MLDGESGEKCQEECATRSETWALGKAEQNLLGRTQENIEIWMMGIKTTEMIRNEEIRARAGKHE